MNGVLDDPCHQSNHKDLHAQRAAKPQALQIHTEVSERTIKLLYLNHGEREFAECSPPEFGPLDVAPDEEGSVETLIWERGRRERREGGRERDVKI